MHFESYSIKYNTDNSYIVALRYYETKETGDFRGNTFSEYIHYFSHFDKYGKLISFKSAKLLENPKTQKLNCSIKKPNIPTPIEFIGFENAKECTNINTNPPIVILNNQKVNRKKNKYIYNFGLIVELDNNQKIRDIEIKSSFWKIYSNLGNTPSWQIFEYNIDENDIKISISTELKQIIYQDNHNYIILKNSHLYSYNEVLDWGKVNNTRYRVEKTNNGYNISYEDKLIQKYNNIGMNATFYEFSDLKKIRGCSDVRIANSSIDYINLFDLKIGGEFGGNTQYLCRYHEDKSQITIYSDRQSIFWDSENNRYAVENIEYKENSYCINTTTGQDFYYDVYGKKL